MLIYNFKPAIPTKIDLNWKPKSDEIWVVKPLFTGVRMFLYRGVAYSKKLVPFRNKQLQSIMSRFADETADIIFDMMINLHDKDLNINEYLDNRKMDIDEDLIDCTFSDAFNPLEPENINRDDYIYDFIGTQDIDDYKYFTYIEGRYLDDLPDYWNKRTRRNDIRGLILRLDDTPYQQGRMPKSKSTVLSFIPD